VWMGVGIWICLGVGALLVWRGSCAGERDPLPRPAAIGARPGAALPVAERRVPERVMAPAAGVMPGATASDAQLTEGIPDLVAGIDTDRAHRVIMFESEAAARLAARLAREGGVDVRRVGAWVRVPSDQRERLGKLWKGRAKAQAEAYDHVVRLPPKDKSREKPEGVTYLGVGNGLAQVLRLAGDNSDWGTGVLVAVVDSGVAFDLLPAGVAAGEADFTGGLAADRAHGTAVASQILGGKQQFGTAPGARVLSARVVSDAGDGSAFAVAEGILWAAERGAKVINLSLSTRGDSPVLRAAIRSARDAGVVVVAAAGNEGVDSVSYPAAYGGVVAVGAVDARGRHLFFSNRGAVDLVAPGIGLPAMGMDGELREVSGTSVAAPLVAGAAAALLSGDPDASVEEVVGALKRSAADWGLPGEDSTYGAGLLDLGALLQQGEPGVTDVSVAAPVLLRVEGSSADAEVVAVAQNRGTVDVGVLDLVVRVDGDARESTHYNVPPGGSVSMRWRVPIGQDRQVEIEVWAASRTGEDRRPADNRLLQQVVVQ
jgi:hypothetical protein